MAALSKGYRQRLGLAQALLHQPPVLILDEPTIGLDPSQIVEIRSLIKNLEGAHTVILSSHILPEVSQLCHRVIIINRGQIVASDTPENLSRQLGHGARISLTVKGPEAKVTAALQALPGVGRVASQGGAATWWKAATARTCAPTGPPAGAAGLRPAGVKISGIQPGRRVPQPGDRGRVMKNLSGFTALFRKELTIYFAGPIFSSWAFSFCSWRVIFSTPIWCITAS